jgi:hypothetical protein
MKKALFTFLFILSITIANAHEIHKFYVSIFLVENNTKRKELEITSRIFIDDLEKALEQKFNIKAKIGTKNQIANLEKYVVAYLNHSISISANSNIENIKLLGYELENDVLVAYLVAPYTSDIKSITIKNTLLTEIYSEQQNIMHFTINAKKSSILLTKSKTKETLLF